MDRKRRSRSQLFNMKYPRPQINFGPNQGAICINLLIPVSCVK